MPNDVTGDPRRAFQFLDTNDRGEKPRATGVTEIRGPYYSPMGPNYLDDVLSTMGHYVDSLKFAGGSFSLMPEDEVQELLDLAHDHDVLVSTGGFMEYVLSQGTDAVYDYIDECARLGFDIIEISAGFITLPTDCRINGSFWDWADGKFRLVRPSLRFPCPRLMPCALRCLFAL